VEEVQLRCLLDSGAEVSLIDCEVVKCFVGKAVVTLASEKKVPFVVACDSIHEVVLGIDILDNTTSDLAHVFESCWIWQEIITKYLRRVQVGDCSLSQLIKGSMNGVGFHLEL
jgi:hypothetical protein